MYINNAHLKITEIYFHVTLVSITDFTRSDFWHIFKTPFGEFVENHMATLAVRASWPPHLRYFAFQSVRPWPALPLGDLLLPAPWPPGGLREL